MKCSHCGTETADSYKYCANCGALLKKKKLVICINCGSEQDSENKVCSTCGVSFDEFPPKIQAEPKSEIKHVTQNEVSSEQNELDDCEEGNQLIPLDESKTAGEIGEIKTEKKSKSRVSNKKLNALLAVLIAVVIGSAVAIGITVDGNNNAQIPSDENVQGNSASVGDGSSADEQNGVPEEYVVNGVTPPDGVTFSLIVVVNTDEGIYLKSKPKVSSSNVINGKLGRGTELETLGVSYSHSNWVYVCCIDRGYYGWIQRSDVVEKSKYIDKNAIEAGATVSLYDNINNNYWLDDYYLDNYNQSELEVLFSGLSRVNVQYVINSMLARHGYVYTGKAGATGWNNTTDCPNFSTYDWYSPSISDMHVIENNYFNDIELYNYVYLGKLRDQLRDDGKIRNYYPNMSDYKEYVKPRS